MLSTAQGGVVSVRAIRPAEPRKLLVGFQSASNRRFGCGHSHNQSVCQQYAGQNLFENRPEDAQPSATAQFFLLWRLPALLKSNSLHRVLLDFFRDHSGVGHVSSQRVTLHRFGASRDYLGFEFGHTQQRHHSSAYGSHYTFTKLFATPLQPQRLLILCCPRADSHDSLQNHNRLSRRHRLSLLTQNFFHDT